MCPPALQAAAHLKNVPGVLCLLRGLCGGTSMLTHTATPSRIPHAVQGTGSSGRAWQVAQAAHQAAPVNAFGGSVGRQSAPAASYNGQAPSPPDPQVGLSGQYPGPSVMHVLQAP